MSAGRAAIVTVAYGHSTENLDYTFSSFALNLGIPLHAIILGRELPKRRIDGITYHLVEPVPDFSHPLREVYFRRMELIDQLEVDHALVVDSYDVLCLQPLPPFEKILGGSDVAACVEHLGARHLMGQGYTANFLNGGVFFWNVPASRDIRREIVERGRSHFRRRADDQYCINEVIQTKYYDRLRILPCQYNYRAYLNRKQGGWPTVTHLNGVLIYHNAPCIENAKTWLKGHTPQSKTDLDGLSKDPGPLDSHEMFLRELEQWRTDEIIEPSWKFRLFRSLLRRSLVHHGLRCIWPVLVRLKIDRWLRGG
ncbi:MAG TPA: hypothetical protein VJS65_00990 [Verrucomicrobiae bacterium]|nr:hypothetical protein [Verrucomicrobiae bacterium]